MCRQLPDASFTWTGQGGGPWVGPEDPAYCWNLAVECRARPYQMPTDHSKLSFLQHSESETSLFVLIYFSIIVDIRMLY